MRQNLNNNSTNQILNNFKKKSKLYLNLYEVKTEKLRLFSIKSEQPIEIYAGPPSTPPYYEKDGDILLSIIFNTGINNIIAAMEDKKQELSKEMISILAGFFAYSKNPNISFDTAIDKSMFHISHYLSTFQQVSPHLLSQVYEKLGFMEKAIQCLWNIKDDETFINLARIYRKQGNIKKSIELLANVKSSEKEIERNLEYAWLHLQAGKVENSYKIFSYYSSITDEKILAQVYAGMALSIIKDESKINQAKELLIKASRIDSPYKTTALKNLLEIYIDIRDYIKAIEIINELLKLEISADLIYKKAECEFLLSDDESALKDANEAAIFKLRDCISLLEKISPNRIKPVYPGCIIIKKDDAPKNIVEAVLKPEDITESNNIGGSRKMEFISGLEISESHYEIKSGEKDEISTLAFSFSQALEEEFNEKVYFNYEGIDALERKIRITHMSEIPEYEYQQIMKGASAFILFFLKERFKAKIIKYDDMEMWGWPSIIKNKHNLEITTYPAGRIYLLNSLSMEQGYLRKYIKYISDFLNIDKDFLSGREAIEKNIPSDENKIFDAKVEHKKILLISRDIEETSMIPHNSSAILKLESEIRKRFKPNIPPTVDGWKVLRCYAHIFLEMIIKDFNPQWYNVEKNDGLWSFKILNTFIFPIGKVYKFATLNQSLIEYHETLERNFKKHN